MDGIELELLSSVWERGQEPFHSKEGIEYEFCFSRDALETPSEEQEEEQYPAPDAPTLNEFQEKDDAGLYQKFINSSKTLEDKLQDFSQSILKLGSAQGLSSDALGTKKVLALMRSHFEADDKMSPNRNKAPSTMKSKVKKLKSSSADKKRGGELAKTLVTDLSDSLRKLSKSLSKFAIGLTHFDDYYEWKTHSAIDEFRTEILILSEALAYFSSETHRDSPELKMFFRTRLSTASDYNDKASMALVRFVETGIPCISDAQIRSSNMMLNASGVATFFAGVTATALQYAGIDLETTIGRVIQTLWISSLILSVGSAITSVLVVAWRQAIFASTPPKLPGYIRLWMRSGYLVLLSASIFTFISGLIPYVYSLQRPSGMFWAVTACTVFCAISLGNLSLFFALDYWLFSRKSKQDRIQPSQALVPRTGFLSFFWKNRKDSTSASAVSEPSRIKALRHIVSRIRHRLLRLLWLSGYIFPYMESELRGFRWHIRRSLRPNAATKGMGFWYIVGRIFSCFAPESGRTQDHVQSLEDGGTSTDKISYTEVHIQSLALDHEQHRRHTSHFSARRKIYDMQFSPDGQWLAVGTTIQCYVTDSDLRNISVVPCPFVRQVKWSPNGHRLLTRTGDGVQIWNFKQHMFHYMDIIEIEKSLADVEWLGNDLFVALSNDAESLYSVRMNSEVPREIRLLPSGLTIYEMTTIVEAKLILFLATRKVDGLPEEKGISCIIVYDMGSSVNQPLQNGNDKSLEKYGTFKSKVPLSKKAIGLAVADTKKRFVVTHKGAMPDVWQIDTTENDTVSISWRRELRLANQKPKAVWGSASFVGSGGDVIACAENDVVHFWKDMNGEFDFRHFHSLSISNVPKSPAIDRKSDGNDSDSDYSEYTSDSGTDSEDEDEVHNKERALISWNPTSHTMSSGHMGRLKVWTAKYDEKSKGKNTTRNP